MLNGFARGFVQIFVVGVLIILGLVGFIFYQSSNKQSKYIIETKIPPIITWKLEAKGQRVDTIWVYNFKKRK